MTETPPVVLFDLDGTLVDSARDLIATLNVVLGEEGLAPVPFEAVRGLVGQGARAMVMRGLERRGETADEARVARMHDRFLAHYAEHLADETVPFPGVARALEALAAHGCVLGVCTNKYERFSRRVLDALDLSRHFADVIGPDTLGVRKPDPRHVSGAVARLGGTTARALMVGDSAADINAARGAGVASVAVSFGYTSVPASDLGADLVIDHFDALVPFAAARLALAAPA